MKMRKNAKDEHCAIIFSPSCVPYEFILCGKQNFRQKLNAFQSQSFVKNAFIPDGLGMTRVTK